MSLLLSKIWDRHTVLTADDGGDSLIYIDRCFVHEESRNAFGENTAAPLRFFRAGSAVGFVDHYAPTASNGDIASGAREMVAALHANAGAYGLPLYGLDHPSRGIMHVVAPEQGLVLPGTIIVGSDSHCCTYGALGALSFGVGQTELRQVFESQSLWRSRPSSLRIRLEGWFARGVGAKDLILSIIGRLGAAAGKGRVVEFSGPCVSRMSVEQRMTVCNMSIEMGALTSLMTPDDKTIEYLSRCPEAPKGRLFDQACDHWRSLAPRDDDFSNSLESDASTLSPMATWGTSLADVSPVDGRVPDPQSLADLTERERVRKALAYMDLQPGTPLSEINLDAAFIGSCTNGRIEDLREAAAIVRGRRAVIPAIVSPGSRNVSRQAESEGLRRIFEDAGFEWRDSGCSMCVGSNGDIVGRHKRCASSSARNFEGRQGPGSRTHVMSPQMVAYAATKGHIADVRQAIPDRQSP